MIGDLAGRKLAGAEGRQGGGQGREGGGARNRLCCCEDLTGDLAGGNLAEKKCRGDRRAALRQKLKYIIIQHTLVLV